MFQSKTVMPTVLKFSHINRRLPFLVILAAALGLRLYALTFQSMRGDELFSLYDASPGRGFMDVMDRCVGVKKIPPLFYVLFWSWQKLFGTGEWTARLFPVVFGMVGLMATYSLGRELVSRHTGLIAMAIAAMTPYHIDCSQDVRFYSMTYWLSALSYLWLVRSMKSLGWKQALGYVIATVALLYTHYFGLYLLASQIVATCLCSTRQKSETLESGGDKTGAQSEAMSRPARTKTRGILGMAACWIVIVALYVPWIFVITRLAGKSFWISTPPARFFRIYFAQYFNNEPYVVVLFALLMAVYVAGRRTKAAFWSHKMLLGAWLFVTLFLPYVQSLIGTPILYARYTQVVLPAIVLMIAAGLDGIHPPSFRGLLLFTALAMLSVNLFLTNGGFYNTIRNEQIREAVRYVVRQDPSARHPVSTDQSYGYYFNRLSDPPRPIQLPPLRSVEGMDRLIRQFEPLVADGFWYMGPVIKEGSPLQKAIEELFEPAAGRNYHMAAARLFLRRPDHPVIADGMWRPLDPARAGSNAAKGAGVLYRNGAILSTVPLGAAHTEVLVTARGTPALGIWPRMKVDLLGPGDRLIPLIDTFVSSREPSLFTATTRIPEQGNWDVVVTFTNDASAGGEDRNLYLMRCKITQSHAPAPATPSPPGADISPIGPDREPAAVPAGE